MLIRWTNDEQIVRSQIPSNTVVRIATMIENRTKTRKVTTRVSSAVFVSRITVSSSVRSATVYRKIVTPRKRVCHIKKRNHSWKLIFLVACLILHLFLKNSSNFVNNLRIKSTLSFWIGEKLQMLSLEIQKSNLTGSSVAKIMCAISNIKNTWWTQWTHSGTSSEVGLSSFQRKASKNSIPSTSRVQKVKCLKYNIDRRTIEWKFKHFKYELLQKFKRNNILTISKFQGNPNEKNFSNHFKPKGHRPNRHKVRRSSSQNCSKQNVEKGNQLSSEQQSNGSSKRSKERISSIKRSKGNFDSKRSGEKNSSK